MGPLWRGERVEEKPEGARARSARGRCAHTDVRSATPGTRLRTRRAGCPESAPPGCVSFGDFSLHKQRKVTRSPAGRVEALHFKGKIKMDSRLRGNDVKRKELDSGFRRNDELKDKNRAERIKRSVRIKRSAQVNGPSSPPAAATPSAPAPWAPDRAARRV